MLRRLLVFVAILAALAVLADRGLALLAGNAVADAVAQSENLHEKPSVNFHGFPFLTQAIGGTFTDIGMSVRGYQAGGADGVRVDRIDLRLRQVHVGFSHVLKGSVDVVPVQSGTAEVHLRYADLNDYLARRPGDLRLHASSGVLVVKGTVSVPVVGSVPVEGTARLGVTAAGIAVRVATVRSVGGVSIGSSALSRAAGALSFELPLRGLPLCIALRGVSVAADELVVSASASQFVIRTASKRGAGCS
jgi:hypothetical protein